MPACSLDQFGLPWRRRDWALFEREGERILIRLLGDSDDAALREPPNSSSSASGFLMCSWITRASGRAPNSGS